MNSQIYCLPQRHGWNAICGLSSQRAEDNDKYMKLSLKSTKPYSKTNPKQPCADQQIAAEVKRRYPRMPACDLDTSNFALQFVNTTETQREFSSDFTFPRWRRQRAANTLERLADPMRLKKPVDAPLTAYRAHQWRTAVECRPDWHEWRNVRAPGTHVWAPDHRIPTNTNVGKGQNMPPPPRPLHEPAHEKAAWDHCLNTVRQEALAYGYRQEVPGFAGHKPQVNQIQTRVEDYSQKPAHVSTMKASHPPFPQKCYVMPPPEHILIRRDVPID